MYKGSIKVKKISDLCEIVAGLTFQGVSFEVDKCDEETWIVKVMEA